MGVYLITGATSGIGLAMAEQLARQGHQLVLVGRQRLDALGGAALAVADATNYCCADLSRPDAADLIDAWCDARGIDAIDVLINNAGVGYSGDLADQSIASIREMVGVNLVAPMLLTQRLLSRLRAASGTAVFVSSVVSRVGSADMAVYAATKKALDGFVRSARAERSAGEVRFRVVHPGATRTAMPGKVGIPPAQSARWRSAESVAEEILSGLGSRPANRAIGWSNKAVRAGARLAPGPVSRLASRRSEGPGPLPRAGAHQRVLITGAADGIGRALALRYASAGAHVVGIDVDEQRANEVVATPTAGRIEFHLADLRTSDMSWLSDEAPFDVVVHNAGISAVGRFETIPAQDQRDVVAVNLAAPLVLTRELLAAKKITDGGRIVLMSSLSHQMGYPGAAVYAATKDGLELYGRALQHAVGPSVRVTTVFPGPTRTAHASRYSPNNDRATVARRMDPAALAEQIATTGRSRLLPGALARASAVLGTISPSTAEAIMRRTVYAELAAVDD